MFFVITAMIGQAYALTATVTIENVQVSGGELSWEIHFTPTDGWTGGLFGSNTYLNSASWYFDFNSSALSAPVITYTNPDLVGHYASSTGITGGSKVYVSTPDGGDPQSFVQGTKYHMYSVKMTIDDSGQESDLIWNELDTGIEQYGGALADITYMGSGDTSLPVQMSTMYTSVALKEGITVFWQTESEVDCQGFHVWRSVETQDDFKKLTTQLIPGHGNTSAANEYSYLDRDVEKGKEYWYQVEEISIFGISAFHGPIRAEGVQVIPTEFALSQNYPNPFNPLTAIDYDLPRDSRLEIRIYNISGELVRGLINEKVQAGYYQLVWDGTNDLGNRVTTGMYILQMIAEDFRAVRKMNLVK